MKKTRLTILVLAGLCLATTASAMDRWAALAMIESGKCDHAVGRAGEISRFQIKPELWPGGNPRDARTALVAAKNIMNQRLDEFQQNHKRMPTNFEFYVLWNAPAKVDRPGATIAERARRFVNLVQRQDSSAT
jgi:hypothetical protein